MHEGVLMSDEICNAVTIDIPTWIVKRMRLEGDKDRGTSA
jgi:hypothetical protein